MCVGEGENVAGSSNMKLTFTLSFSDGFEEASG